MSWMQGYECATAAGDSAADLWQALHDGRECSRPWPMESGAPLRACLFPERAAPSVLELLLDKLMRLYAPLRSEFHGKPGLGVILASTKGVCQDVVGLSGQDGPDPLTPLLQAFLRRSELAPERALCVSNACSSTLGAMALAQIWFRQGLDQVLLLSADAVTPFVLTGFSALKLIAPEASRPFSADRHGFCLGEAASLLWLTRERRDSQLLLHPVGLDSEGSAVTRPSHSGESLERAALAIPGLRSTPPEILIAHGTGTTINDETEDLAFSKVFIGASPWITGSKWCIGHTLGASGAVDTVAACEILRRQDIFRLATTSSVDPKFKGRYLSAMGAEVRTPISRVMISSLGFGGMHASALLERVPK